MAAQLSGDMAKLHGLVLERSIPCGTTASGRPFIEKARNMQVDVLVSEWMGYALLLECMLDTVLYARDR